jgi:hypothetical protein
MFYRYLAGCGVHFADCSGAVSLALGVQRLDLLERELAARPSHDGVQRLLIDFRDTVWESEAVHRQLSMLTRERFGLGQNNPNQRVAFLHRELQGGTTEFERWFRAEAEALAWLSL